MKIHSDILTYSDLGAALPPSIYVDVQQCGSRKRARGFTVYLEYIGPKQKGRRASARGGFGYANERPVAATWDEWGIWMARLFDIDPDAIIGYYNTENDFYQTTAQYVPKNMQAPWLTESVLKN